MKDKVSGCKPLLQSFLFLIGIQGCSYHDRHSVVNELAQNRSELISYDETHQNGVELISIKAEGNVVKLTIKVPSLNTNKIKSYPDIITEIYCDNDDIRRFMEVGGRYQLSVLSENSTSSVLFNISKKQCIST
jgi:hypothetical protein